MNGRAAGGRSAWRAASRGRGLLRPLVWVPLLLLLGSPFTGPAGCAAHYGRNFTLPDRPVYEENAGFPAAASDTIRVVSFNVKYGQDVDRAIAQLEAPETAGAAIVLLQEMDSAGVREIADALGYNYVYYPAVIHVHTGREFGDAILVKGRILERDKIILPHLDPNRLQREAVYARVEIGRRRLDVYCLHLGTRISAIERGDQIQTVIGRIGDDPVPCIIGGDFNTWNRAALRAVSEPLTELGFREATAGVRWTFRFDVLGITLDTFRFDHIYTRGLTQLDAGRARKHISASDHWPVWARVVLPARG